MLTHQTVRLLTYKRWMEKVVLCKHFTKSRSLKSHALHFAHKYAYSVTRVRGDSGGCASLMFTSETPKFQYKKYLMETLRVQARLSTCTQVGECKIYELM
jgi:hypothetical protein